jgi:hypothetical protein
VVLHVGIAPDSDEEPQFAPAAEIDIHRAGRTRARNGAALKQALSVSPDFELNRPLAVLVVINSNIRTEPRTGFA